MRLTFEYIKTAGAGLSPQAVHMMDNGLRFIYVTSDGLVEAKECFPDMGLYDDLVYTDKGRTSADFEVSKPQLKKVAHHGAYGFWSSEDTHRFVIYMLPYDVSAALVDGNISFTKDSPVSQLSISFMNLRGELVGRHRSALMPNTILEISFAMGSSSILPLGKFYIDRVSTAYPEENISVSARNSIGKLLKEQTFDDNNSFQNETLKENLEAILQLSGIENYFVGDPQKDWKLTFNPDTDMQSGIEQVISLLPGWQLRENTDGMVGIALTSDIRFEQPSLYEFERDKNCFSYDVEYSDETTYSKLCIICKEPEQTVFVTLPPHKWWLSPQNKTMYVTVPDGTGSAEIEAYADELARLIAISGRIESFAGIFTPQLIVGDEIELVETNGRRSKTGTVTSVRHKFGKGGFITEFTVDSSGRKGKALLKDYVSQIGGKSTQSKVVIS
jgi:hypothetical protein